MPDMTRDVLIVEDSRFFSTAMKDRFESELGMQTTLAGTFAEAEGLLGSQEPDYLVAVVGFDLPDAPKGEIIDLVRSYDIPTIVFSSGVSDVLSQRLWDKRIVDYVLKGTSNSLDYLSALVSRLERNRRIEAMIVDDSAVVRKHASALLRAHQFMVYTAKDGEEGLKMLAEHPDIRMVLTDYEMPNMDGVELTERMRSTHNRDQLAIIGVSSSQGPRLSAKFLKGGANDFIRKPFETEEFYCRVTQNIEMLEHVALVREASQRDFLTGLHNRRHFFEIARTLYSNARRKNLSIAVAMLDIDHFKRVNDTYGHDVGDLVLKQVARVLKRRFRRADVVARFGGEEFCVMVAGVAKSDAFSLFDTVREMIAKESTHTGDGDINVTISVGICLDLLDSLEEMIRTADTMLYEAKKGGRNRVEVYSPDGQPELVNH